MCSYAIFTTYFLCIFINCIKNTKPISSLRLARITIWWSGSKTKWFSLRRIVMHNHDINNVRIIVHVCQDHCILIALRSHCKYQHVLQRLFFAFSQCVDRSLTCCGSRCVQRFTVKQRLPIAIKHICQAFCGRHLIKLIKVYLL